MEIEAIDNSVVVSSNLNTVPTILTFNLILLTEGAV